MSPLKQSDINSVIFVGGASRTPMVQSAVKALVGEYVDTPFLLVQYSLLIFIVKQ